MGADRRARASSPILHRNTLRIGPEESQEATGSGGLVEIETKSGLDYGNFQISGGIEREMTPASGFGHEWEANGTIAGKITDAFGLAATIDYRKTDRTNYDVFNNSFPPTVFPAGFSNVFLIPSDMQFPFDPEFNERLDTSVTYIRSAAGSTISSSEASTIAATALRWTTPLLPTRQASGPLAHSVRFLAAIPSFPTSIRIC